MKAPNEIQNIEENIMELLKKVIDPEVEINIVDMGLIYNLEHSGDNKVDIKMTLPII